jgi:4-hydroxyphenylpyruvate dioxygenase-like putative hemolysin
MQKKLLDFNISHVSILYDGGRSGSIFLQWFTMVYNAVQFFYQGGRAAIQRVASLPYTIL